MAQKSLPTLNRTGSYQHWLGAWDSYKNYNLAHKQHLLIEAVLTDFISYRNSVHHLLVTETFCLDEAEATRFEIPEGGLEPLSQALRAHRTKRKLYGLVGRVVFVRAQGWIIVVAYFYKPLLIHRVRRAKLRNMELSFQWTKRFLHDSAHVRTYTPRPTPL